MNGNGVWKFVATSLASIALTVIAMLSTVGMPVTRAEVERIVQRQAPYIEDKKQIMDYMKRHDQAMKEIRQRLRGIERKVK